MVSLTRRVLLGAALVIGASAAGSPVTPHAEAAFPARNGRIVFTVGEVRGHESFEGFVDSDLFTVSPSGHDVRQLTQTRGSAEFEPKWSPDGRRVIFSRLDATGGPGLAIDVYVMDATDPSSATRLTDSPLGNDESPAWSPDGTKITLARDSLPTFFRPPSTPSSEIFVMDSDGGQILQLTDGPGDSYDPEWSPDGKTIAYVYNANDRSGTIRLIGPDGSGDKTLTLGVDPSWSPDGQSVAFQSLGDIFVIDLDRPGFLRNLTAAHGEATNQDPAWSPDGKWIAFVSNRDGDFKLYKMRSDGSDVTKIIDITIGATRSGIDWGPRPSRTSADQ